MSNLDLGPPTSRRLSNVSPSPRLQPPPQPQLVRHCPFLAADSSWAPRHWNDPLPPAGQVRAGHRGHHVPGPRRAALPCASVEVIPRGEGHGRAGLWGAALGLRSLSQVKPISCVTWGSLCPPLVSGLFVSKMISLPCLPPPRPGLRMREKYFHRYFTASGNVPITRTTPLLRHAPHLSPSALLRETAGSGETEPPRGQTSSFYKSLWSDEECGTPPRTREQGP